MDDIKMILKLHFEGLSQRQIAERMKRSRNTVSEILRATAAQQLSLEQIADLSEDELTENVGALVPPHRLILSHC